MLANLGILLRSVHHQWFFFDEWEAIANRHGGTGILEPHNEHPLIIVDLMYQGLLHIFGLRTYLPYVGMVVLTQLVLAHLLWRLLIRCGVRPHTATAVVFVFGMAGVFFENLLWAFQMGFVGSLACGVAALLVTDGEGPPGAGDAVGVVLGIAAWMFSGVGLTTILIVAGTAALRRRWTAAALLAVIPLGTYGVWAVRYASDKLEGGQPLMTGLRSAPAYAANGLSKAFGSIVGLDSAGPVLIALVLLGVAGAVGPWRGRLAPIAGGLAGSVLFLLLAGVRRSDLGLEQAGASRYAEVVLCFALPAIAFAVDRALIARPPLVTPALAVAVFVAGLQVNELVNQSNTWAARSQSSRHQILVAADVVRSGESVFPSAQVESTWAPDLDAGELRRLVDSGWVPTTDDDPATLLAVQNSIQTAVLDVGQRRFPEGTVSLLGVALATAGPRTGDGCVAVSPTAPSATIALRASGKGAVEVRTDAARSINIQSTDTPRLTPVSPAKSLVLPAGGADVALADPTAIVVLTIPDTAPLTVCGLAP